MSKSLEELAEGISMEELVKNMDRDAYAENMKRKRENEDRWKKQELENMESIRDSIFCGEDMEVIVNYGSTVKVYTGVIVGHNNNALVLHSEKEHCYHYINYDYVVEIKSVYY